MLCDSHVHVVAPLSEGPQIPGRTFLAEEAPLSTLVANGAPFGIERFVIVQASFYGTDNAVLLRTLDELDGRGRGVATVSPSASGGELAAMKERGVEGLRVNLYSPAAKNVGSESDDLTAVVIAAQAARMHVEIIAPLDVLLANEESIVASPVPIVLDHYGLPGTIRPTEESGTRLVALTRHSHVWMKLSSPYRRKDAPLNVEPDGEWLDAFLAAAPDRCVWGSDWPHPPAHEDHRGPDVVAPFRRIAYADLVDRFLDAVGSAESREQVMNDNPARLYGFDR